MQAEAIVKRSISYIEQNLKEELRIEDLAQLAGYSVGHYQKLFSQITGISVATFLNKRRLDVALSEIRRGRRAIDAAFDYGFDSYAGFYKAFVRVYGNSPKKILSHKEELSMYLQNELRNVLVNWDILQDLPILNISILDDAAVADNVWAVGEDYILKTNNYLDLKNKEAGKSRLLNNLEITKTLAATGAHVSKPLVTKSGDYYHEVGSQIFTLTQGIKGEPLSKAQRFGEKHAYFGNIYGNNIALLHQSLKAVESKLTIKETNLYETITEWALPAVKKINLQWNMEIPDHFFEDYVDTFGKLYPELVQQLIHRDPNPENIMFMNDEFSGFIDFDLSERNVRLWDPCYCSTGLLCAWKTVPEIETLWPTILASVLKGYDQINPLSEAEKAAIYYVVCAIQMICVAYFDGIPELQELVKTNREMLQYIITQESTIKNIFEA